MKQISSRLLPLIFILATHSLGSIGYAGVTIVSQRSATAPLPANCQAEQTCDIVSLRFKEYKKRLELKGETLKYANWFTDTRFALHTRTPQAIESFAVVQYLRGCLFNSQLENGQVTKTLTIQQQYFGQMVTFQHRTWEIDSDTTDPIYTSNVSSLPNSGRFALWRWNQNPASLNPETATWYAQSKPPTGAVFLTDLPGPGFLSQSPPGQNDIAQNASLEFRTCLFHIEDVPVMTTPAGSGINPSRAIWCVNWDHKFVYDFRTGKMTSPRAIDPICDIQ
jgi:hypothetical protein